MRTLLDLISDIRRKEKAIKIMTEKMPDIIGTECVRVIKSNFVKSNPAGWAARAKVTDIAYDYNRTSAYRTPVLEKKSKYKNPYKGSVVSSKRPILVQTGNLRDSITYDKSGNEVIIGVMPNTKKAGALQEAHTYAKKMNEGGTGKWGKNTTNTPARKFMPTPSEGPNEKMVSAITKKIDFEVNKIMEDWK